MTEQNAKLEWLEKEAKEIEKQKEALSDRKPSLVMEEGKITAFDVDFTKPFETYEDAENNTTKAIIPVKQDGEEKTLWLNKRNPLYGVIIQGGKEGQKTFRVMRSGQKKATRYTEVKD